MTIATASSSSSDAVARKVRKPRKVVPSQHPSSSFIANLVLLKKHLEAHDNALPDKDSALGKFVAKQLMLQRAHARSSAGSSSSSSSDEQQQQEDGGEKQQQKQPATALARQIIKQQANILSWCNFHKHHFDTVFNVAQAQKKRQLFVQRLAALEACAADFAENGKFATADRADEEQNKEYMKSYSKYSQLRLRVLQYVRGDEPWPAPMEQSKAEWEALHEKFPHLYSGSKRRSRGAANKQARAEQFLESVDESVRDFIVFLPAGAGSA